MSEQEFAKTFGKRLRYFLERDNMTQAELAKKLGVGTTSVSNWVNGIKTPRMNKVDAMCEIFGCKRSDFISEDTNNDSYYIDSETRRLADRIYRDPDLRALFDAADDSKSENVKLAAEMLKRMKDTNPDG